MYLAQAVVHYPANFSSWVHNLRGMLQSKDLERIAKYFHLSSLLFTSFLQFATLFSYTFTFSSNRLVHLKAQFSLTLM